MSTFKYERLVEEDLNVGTDTTWIHAPGGGELRSIQIGLFTFARGQKQYTAAWTPGAITTGSNASTTLTVPDAAVADFVIASHDKILTNDLRIMGHVSAANTAKVVIHNPTSATVTVPAGTVAVLVFPSITGAAPVVAEGATVSGAVYTEDGGTTYFPGISVTMTVDGVPWPGGPATTDGDGYYSFLNVPAGAIVVSASDATIMGSPYSGSNSGTCVPPTTLTLHIVMTGE